MSRLNPDIAQELLIISPAVANLDTQLPFEIPAGYFENLPEQIMQKLLASETSDAEISRLSPLLAEIKSKPAFEVPAGYFDQLSHQAASFIQDRAKPAPELPVTSGKLVSMHVFRTWQRIAVAAVITAVIAGSAWYFTRTPETIGTTEPGLVAINDPVQQNDSLQVSMDALVSFLDEEEALPIDDLMISDDSLGKADLAILDLNEKNFSEILQDVPDGDLEAFVNENPGTDSQEIIN